MIYMVMDKVVVFLYLFSVMDHVFKCHACILSIIRLWTVALSMPKVLGSLNQSD